MSDPNPGYKKLLIECLELRRQGGQSAHRRATLLVRVYEDVDWRSEQEAVSDDALEEILDQYVEDLCLKFLELREMLQQFPDEEPWRGGQLRKLYDECRNRKIEPPESETQRSVPHYKQLWNDECDNHNDTKFHVKKLTEANRQDQERLATLEQQVIQLQAENQQLRDDNCTLKGRLAELERLFDRETVTA